MDLKTLVQELHSKIEDETFVVSCAVGDETLIIRGKVQRDVRYEKSVTDEHGLSEYMSRVLSESYKVIEVEQYDSFGDFSDLMFTKEEIEFELNML